MNRSSLLAFLLGFVVVVVAAFLAIDREGSEPISQDHAGIACPGSGKWAQTPKALTRKSLAVLPFAALSTGPDDGYFADGLSEEIINTLNLLPGG